MSTKPEIDRLRAENEDLRSQLADANDALQAIRSGEVDALVVQTHEGERVFALESAYEPYRVFVENMQEGAAALTPDGLIVYANARLAEITGVAHSRLVGTSIYQILGDPNRPVIQTLLAETAVGTREAEIVLTPGDGRIVHTYFSVTVMPDGTRCAVVTDLTERVRLHEILASHEWLRVTLTSIGDAVLSCDLHGRITFLNPVAETLTGWSEREVLGRPIQQVFRIVNELTREPGEDLATRVLRDGAVATLANHTAIVTRDGREVSIEDSAAPIRDAAGKLAGVVLVFHDVTQKRAARRALADSQARLQSVLNSITNGYYALDADWRFIAANRITEQHFGRAPGELLGENIWDLAGASPDSIQYQRFREARGTSRPVHFEAPSTVQPEVWTEMHVYPLDGGLEVYFADISKRKRAEESLRQALLDLQSAKLSAERAKAAAEEASHAKDHFMAVLSHELRTPLSPVLTAATLLQADDALSPRARGFVDVIRRNVELESRLIDDLLDLTLVARGKIKMNKQTVDLSTVIAGAVEVCRPDIDARRLHFGVDFGKHVGPFLVEGDPARLEQVVWNLLKNAIKFTPKGGCVGVWCREVENGQVVVEVNDSGIGIDSEMLPRVFDAFAQAEASLARQFGGLGLGLAISKSLVELQGGTIEAESAGTDRGATFRIRLPLLTRDRRDQGRTTPQTTSAPKFRILLVDDHGDTIEMLKAILELEGHEVRTAADAATALQMAGELEFDLLLSDLGLPDKSGLELMREIRAGGSNMCGIALSGYGQETDIEHSLAAGFSEHLVKPADPQVLLRTIDRVVARRADGR
jgi:two-component system, chemotaxis family, CheB/CheR fusion protein